MSADEKKYRTGGRVAAVWTFIRGNGRGLPFKSDDIKMTADRYQMDGGGARQILAMGSVELENVSRTTYLGSGRGRAVEDVDLERRVEALFGLIGFLATYMVDENSVARRRFRALEEDLARTLVKIRDFFSSNRRLVAIDQFVTAFTVAFNTAFGEWARDLAEEGIKLQSGRQGGGIPTADNGQLSPIPLPAFAGLWRMLEIAPLTQLT
ncbi:unnamed protein product, partial [Pylaiella littoralis]